MDPRVSLTWLLLLSAAFLPDPGRAELESSQTDVGTQSQNSLWKKIEEWLEGLFKPKASTPAPTSSPTTAETSSAPGIWTTLEEGEIATSAPEIATIADKASEDTEESYISPTPLPGDSGTSAPETLSTAAEPSTDNFVTDFIVSDPVPDSTELLTTPAPLSTLSEASSTPTFIVPCASARTARPKTTTAGTAVFATAEPDGNTSPAEDITPEADGLIGSTIAENPDSGAEVITTFPAEPDPAPDSQANPISLPQYLRMELLKFLTTLCGPRRPGMQSIQLQQCVMLPTCRNYHSRDERIIKFDFRGPIASRVCLHCNILACNRYSYALQHYQGHRTREEASESVIIRMIPI